MKLTKIDVIRRQLETAVMLYFNDGDPVSIHTLALACNEILSALNGQRGNQLFSFNEELTNDPELKKKVREVLVGSKNFFKHADRDSETVHDFKPEGNEYWLFDCCEKYLALTRDENPHFLAFKGWFASLHPDIFKVPEFQIIKEKFGNRKLDFYREMLSISAERRGRGFFPTLNQ